MAARHAARGHTTALRKTVLAAAAAIAAGTAFMVPLSGANAASVAGFTTTLSTEQAECVHGNPVVNCNTYSGKQFVYMNGGSVAAVLGDGTYFFAVVAPGGQNDPNDGSADNLSDDVDAIGNRTFTVSGGSVFYGGTHNFAEDKIGLADFADTTNNGGVYIMEICSLTNGLPVSRSDCKTDAFKVQAGNTPPPPPASEPDFSKTAAATFATNWTWGVQKSVAAPTSVNVLPGGSATFNYTVSVTHDSGTPGSYIVKGAVNVGNGNGAALDLSSLTENGLSDGTACSFDTALSFPLTVNPGTTSFPYTCATTATAPDPATVNNASGAWDTQFLLDGTLLDGNSANFSSGPVGSATHDAARDVDECVNVTDNYAGALGTVCTSDINPATFTYSLSFPGVTGTCTSYTNTATFTTNDTATTGSASQSVSVCVPKLTGGLTMGFWSNKNGQGIITGQAKTGVCPSATWLRQFAPFQDLSATATCAQVAAYDATAFKNASAAGAAMNAMLKAQMLATALDVYFSDPALGGSKIGAFGGSNTPLGGKTIDLTTVCSNIPTCTSFINASGAFGGATSLTVMQALTYAASQSNAGGTSWYGQVKTTQEKTKDVFDAINNSVIYGF